MLRFARNEVAARHFFKTQTSAGPKILALRADLHHPFFNCSFAAVTT